MPGQMKSGTKGNFWSHVDKAGPNGCWLWIGALDRHGYGRCTVGRRNYGAHRWAYIELKGEIPQGLQLDHLCRVPRCVNPDHLEPVTNRENSIRGKSLVTHCRYGHPLDGHLSTRNMRYCKTCNRLRSRARYAAKRVVAA